jgi:WD40 repeat protein
LLHTWNLKPLEGDGAFAFTSNGKDYAVGLPLVQGKTSQVELRDTQTQALKQTIKVNASDVYSLAFSPDGRTLAIAAGTFLVVYNLRTDTSLYIPDRAPNDFIDGVFNPTGEASYVSFSANSKFIAVVGLLGQVKLWDVTKSEFVESAVLTPKGRGIPSADDPSVTAYSAVISPNASTVAVAGWVNGSMGSQTQGAALWLWHTKNGAVTNLITAPIKPTESTGMAGAAFNPQGTILASGDSTGTIQLRNAVSGKLMSTSYTPPLGYTKVAFSPDGRRLASGEWIQSAAGNATSGAVQTWNVYTSSQKKAPSSVTASDLMSAPVPAACEHAGGNLSYGVQRGLPQYHGSTQLAWLSGGSAARARLTAFGPLSGNRTQDAATVLDCNAGGVPWPQIIAFYGPGPTLLGWSYMSDFKLPGKQTGENTLATSIAYHDGGITADWSTQDEGDPDAVATLDYSADLRLVNGKIVASNLVGVTEEPTAQAFVSDIRAGNLAAAYKLAAPGVKSTVPALVHDHPSAFSASVKCYGLTAEDLTMPTAISQLLTTSSSNGVDRVCILPTTGSSAQWIVLAMQHLGFRHWQVLWISQT